MRVLCKVFVEKFVRSSLKPMRHNRFSDSVDHLKDSGMLIKAGHMKLKESGFEDLLDQDNCSPKFKIDSKLKPKMYINETGINTSINSKRFLDVGRHAGLPDVDLSKGDNRNFSNSRNAGQVKIPSNH